jgi:hypothetical protein
MNIVSTLKKYGVIQEMNDWKKHFTDGTKRQPKTDPEILDFVEDLIFQVFQGNEEKVKNCKLAPWVVKIVKEIGVNDISEEQKNKISTVLNWFKLSGNEGNIKNMNLDDAFQYAENKGVSKKEKEEEKPVEEDTLILDAEKEGRIKRIYTVNDGSKRIWVEVIDGKWLSEPCELNENNKWGVMCQTGSGFAGSENQNIQLIGPPAGNSKGKWSTQLGMSGYRSNKNLREIKQEGNHQPGSQRTAAGYSDGDERIIDFLCFSPYAKSNISKITTYYGALPSNNSASGAARFLVEIIQDKPDLLNKLADHREDLIEVHKDLIMDIKGPEWFDERNVDIKTLAENDPEKFLDKFENLVKKFGNEAIEELLKIDLISIYNKNPQLILKNISSFIGRIPEIEFQKIFEKISLDLFINQYPDSFKNLLRFLSDERGNKTYQGIFNYIIDNKAEETCKVFGNAAVGIANFMKFAESPRERKHQNAKYNPSKKEYIGVREELVFGPDGQPLRDAAGNRITKPKPFVIKDDKKVLLQKERKKFIEKNKQLIKNFIKGDEFNKELQFLKFYVPQLNDQEVNKILNTTVDNQQSNLKDKIVDYYTKKYNEFEQDKSKGKALLIQKYGKNVVDVDGNVIIKEFLPGILEFYNNFKFSNPQDNFVPLSELKKHQQELVTYYYRNSQKASDAEKRVYAFGQFLELCKDNKVSREELIKFIKQVNVNPAQNLSLATLFYKVVLNVLDKKFAINEIKNLKSTFDALGEDGKRNYENLVQSLSIDKYKVNRGDRMMFKGNEPKLPELDLISGKKYLIIDTKNLYKEDQFEEETNDTLLYENLIAINYYVLVTEENEIENGGQNIWVPASRFDVRKEQVLDYTLNENFKLFESKFIKLKNIVSESENSNPRYSAIVLDQPSKDKLLKIIDNLKKEGTIGENWIISADHITINMGKIYDSELLGRIVNIKVIGIGYNDKVVALRVSTDTDIDYSRKVKRTPHITLAFNREEGGKPSMSNSIENWNNFNNISLKGIIQEIY